MSFVAFILIFISIFMHVAWNMISKSVKPSLAFYGLMSTTGALIWLPFFIVSDWNWSALPYRLFFMILASIAAEVFYVGGLARGYAIGEVSLIYPLVRALPVLMVAALTGLTGIGTPLTRVEWLGMAVVSIGCLTMPLQTFREFSFRRYTGRVYQYILIGAIGISIYTIMDGGALEILRKQPGITWRTTDVLAYLFIIEFGLATGTLFLVLCDKREHRCLRELVRKIHYPIMAGFCSSGAYALILVAMGYVSNVAYIQAFRQLSLPLGFLAGVLILKEAFSAPKVAGMLLILAGLILITLG